MPKSITAHDGQFVFPKRVTSWDCLAELGCFVYVYLRMDGSPYYVGIAKNHLRPLYRHKAAIQPPKAPSRIRVLRFALTWEEACYWERVYIAHYGRKDNFTGILRNRTDGGDGTVGIVRSTQTRANMSAAQKGKTHSAETRAKMSKTRTGRRLGEEARLKMIAAQKGRSVCEEHRAKIREGKRNSCKTAKAARESGLTRARNAAIRNGVDPDVWLQLSKNQRIQVREKSKSQGLTAAQYIEKMRPRWGLWTALTLA